MSAVSARAAGAVAGGAVGLLAGLSLLLPSAASALEPLPLPSAGTVVGALVPSPSPSPSASATPLDPVLSQLPAPVGGPVREAIRSGTGAAPAPAPPAPAPAPAPAPGVQPNAGSAPQQVSAPRTGRAALPALRGGSFFTGGSSGLAPLAAGSRTASLDTLFAVPDVAAPLAVLPQAAPASAGRPGTVPAGLPALVVVLAAVSVGGAALGQLAMLRARRAATTA